MTGDNTDGINFKKLFASIDAMDTEGFLGFIHEDATFRFGSSPAATGHEAIRAAVEGFFSSFSALRHDLQRVIADGDAVACEGEVTYTRHDDGLISRYHVYIDIGPLFQP